MADRKRALASKWWDPISETLDQETDLICQTNARIEKDVEALEDDVSVLEKEMIEFNKFLDVQLLFLKDLELQRIDIGLYMQKTQSHAVTWYKSIVNEIDINTLLQKDKLKRQKRESSRGRRPLRLSTGDVTVFPIKNLLGEEDENNGTNSKWNTKEPVNNTNSSCTKSGGLQVARSRTETEDLWSKHLENHESSVIAVSKTREKVRNLLAKEQEVLRSACEHMDRYIAAVSKNISRLRETRDIFLVCLREKRKDLRVQRDTLLIRKRIYET